MRTGRCNCGAIRFTTHGPLRGVVYCHCSMCRRQTGHFYAATSVADADLRIEGGENLTWYSGSDFARRGFCRICGSALFWKPAGEARTSIGAGTFDQPSGLEPVYHIFCADMGDYYGLDDDLPKFERSPPGITVAEG